MPSIAFHATSEDLKLIVDHLNEDDEIAYLIPDGKNRWKAVLTVETLHYGSVRLWHIPAGDLFFTEGNSEELQQITDPWSGWEMSKSESMKGLAPYFPTETQTKIYSLEFRPFGYGVHEIGLSTLGWLGNHYSVIGIKANAETEKHWLKTKRWFNKVAKVMKRVEDSNDVRLNAWAFPDALLQKESSKSFAVNP